MQGYGGINNHLKKFMKQTIYKAVLVIVSGMIGFTSCKKTEALEDIGDKGITVVKIISGGRPDHTVGQTLTGIDFADRPQTIVLADVRRDPNNSTALNSSLQLQLKLDTVLLKRLNDTLVAQGSSPLLRMPSSWYTLSTGGTPGSSITLSFAPGEISKKVSLIVPNAELLDPASTYGFPFSITNVSNADNKISTHSALVAKVGAKNPYDGIYELSFSNYHPTANAAYVGEKVTVHMITTGSDKVKIYWPDEGEFANPALLSGSLTYFGSQEPEYTIDASSNAVTVQNAFAGATTFYTMNPGYTSYYDVAAKKIYAKWGYSYVNGTFAAGTSREWTQEFKYVGSR